VKANDNAADKVFLLRGHAVNRPMLTRADLTSESALFQYATSVRREHRNGHGASVDSKEDFDDGDSLEKGKGCH
jgi:hypothetical protein